MKRREIMWAINGKLGLYTHTYFTRRDAVFGHCRMLGKTWEYCRKKGDRAVKVTVKIVKKRNINA